MDEAALVALKDRLEAADVLDEALAEEAVVMLNASSSGSVDAAEAKGAILGSAESTIRIVGQLFPGWALSFDGHASAHTNVKWRCRLSESRGPDDDQIVGIGNANSMCLALLAAVAHIRQMRLVGYR